MLWSILLKNWRIWAFLALVIFAGLILSYGLHILNASNNRANNAEKTLIEYVNAQKLLNAEYKHKYEQSLTILQKQNEDYEGKLNAINQKYNSANVDISVLRNRLRDTLQHRAAENTSASDSEATPRSEPNSDTTSIGYIETLEQACSITTLQYNHLREWSNQICTIVECVN